QLMFYGRGAGGDPTAASVVGDLVQVSRHVVHGGRAILPAAGLGRRIRAMDDTRGQYYLNLHVEDRPGVLAEIAERFGHNGGSIVGGRSRLPASDATPVVTLCEGGTPLVRSHVLSEETGCEVWLKYEGANPTGSFKDRGMTLAISKALEEGAKAVVCASTGNTSASAAAYAARAGLTCAVLVPKGKVALGKMAATLAHGARMLEIDGNFDESLQLA